MSESTAGVVVGVGPQEQASRSAVPCLAVDPRATMVAELDLPPTTMVCVAPARTGEERPQEAPCTGRVIPGSGCGYGSARRRGR